MSPASYLTAPPRVAGSSIAPCRRPGSLADAAIPTVITSISGEGVQDEVIAGDDNRQHDDERVDDAETAHPRPARELHEPVGDADREAGVQARHRRDRVRERRRMRRADVDPGERAQGVGQSDVGEPGGAVGNSQWMTTEIAVAIRNAFRTLRKPSRERKYSHVKDTPVRTKCRRSRRRSLPARRAACRGTASAPTARTRGGPSASGFPRAPRSRTPAASSASSRAAGPRRPRTHRRRSGSGRDRAATQPAPRTRHGLDSRRRC